LILLNVPPLRTDGYLDLVRQGASPAYTKIRNDTFRTLTTDPLFRRRVTENSLTRVLNAIAWKLHDAHEARVNGWMSPPTLSVPKSIDGYSDQVTSPTSRHRASITGTEGSEAGDGATHVGYVQGMNVMAAPFLYAARSEAEAFAAFDRFITVECPGYVRGSMDGVHRGLALVDKILAIVDPKLSAYLASKGMEARIYAFASVLTMCACTPPLPEVLQLWDFCFAYGPHMNLLCIVAQLVLIRDQLLTSPRYVSYLLRNSHCPLTRFLQSQPNLEVVPASTSLQDQTHGHQLCTQTPRRSLSTSRRPCKMRFPDKTHNESRPKLHDFMT
jgi:cell cycle arrest protein BUB2